MLEHLSRDLRYAFRALRAKPGFTAAVVLTIGLGIGANAAMFGIVDRMLFRPPPFMKDPGTVDKIYTSMFVRGKDSPGDVGQYANFVDLTAFAHSCAATAGFVEVQLAVGTGDQSREMSIAGVSGTFFGFFDAPAVVGRYFTAAEDSTPAYFVPITAYAATASRDASWLRGKKWWRTYNWGWMSMMARRKPGVTIAAANADLTDAYRRSYRLQIVENPRSTPEATSRPYRLVSAYRSTLGVRRRRSTTYDMNRLPSPAAICRFATVPETVPTSPEFRETSQSLPGRYRPFQTLLLRSTSGKFWSGSISTPTTR